MSARGPYLMTSLALVGLGAIAMGGEPLAIAAVVFVAWLLLSIVGWEAAHR